MLACRMRKTAKVGAAKALIASKLPKAATTSRPQHHQPGLRDTSPSHHRNMSTNPIIPGFAPDPSIVLADGRFFLVTSSFHAFPGLPIYTSTDLVSWKHIGNAFNRREQMSLALSSTTLHPQDDGRVMLAQGGLFAPTIRYRNGTFYIICTNVKHPGPGEDDETDNFVVSTTDIWADKWSDPVWYDFHGIDPSIYFDDDGKCYITGSHSPGPWTKIHLFEMDLETGKKLTEEKEVWAGTGGIYPEGPHIYKRNGMYYLLISEGGTYEDHSIVVARSSNIWGPYESCPRNPILTARGTDEHVQYTGHCDMFDDAAGDSWGVCLAVRKTPEARFVMGRETFITPGGWQDDGWPSLELVKSAPKGLKASAGPNSLTAEPLVGFLYIRDANLSNIRVTGDSSIALTPTHVDLSSPAASPSFVGRRQRKLEGNASVRMRVSGNRDLQAGLACYKDEHRYLRLFFDRATQQMVFECRNEAQKLQKKETFTMQANANANARLEIELRMSYSEKHYEMQYKSAGSESWQAGGRVDTLEMTDHDFTGPIIGVFAVSQEKTAPVECSGFGVD